MASRVRAKRRLNANIKRKSNTNIKRIPDAGDTVNVWRMAIELHFRYTNRSRLCALACWRGPAQLPPLDSSPPHLSNATDRCCRIAHASNSASYRLLASLSHITKRRAGIEQASNSSTNEPTEASTWSSSSARSAKRPSSRQQVVSRRSSSHGDEPKSPLGSY